MANWNIDPTHSEISFKVKHLMISTVSGKFEKFDGSVESTDDNDFSNATVRFTADINSINTAMEMRDNHLKSDDFFNAEKYPKLSFASTSMEKTQGEQYLLKGNLTIRETTLPVTLKAHFLGTMVDFYGNTKAGFEIQGAINRKEFGLNWSATTEAGGIVVSDEVRLQLDVQLQKTA